VGGGDPHSIFSDFLSLAIFGASGSASHQLESLFTLHPAFGVKKMRTGMQPY
jgi:hypothetical protein